MYCLHGGRYKKANTLKSEVVKKTVNPVWTLPEVRMGKVDPAGYKAFMIKIWDDDTFSDDFIGHYYAGVLRNYDRHC